MHVSVKPIDYNMNSKENSVEFSIEFQKAAIIRKNGCFLCFCKNNVDKNTMILYYTEVDDNDYQYI